MTLALLDNVWHGDTTNADDSVALTLGQGVLTLVQTVTDADGDSASAAVDLGANGVFRFEDDGPRAGLAVEAPSLGRAWMKAWSAWVALALTGWPVPP